VRVGARVGFRCRAAEPELARDPERSLLHLIGNLIEPFHGDELALPVTLTAATTCPSQFQTGAPRQRMPISSSSSVASDFSP
jgi:hypothetical protein